MITIKGKEYEVLNKTVCNCGYEFKINDITNLEDIKEKGFYGNLVKFYSNSRCPKCGKDVLLLLQQKGQTYEIIDIAIEKWAKTLASNSKISQEKVISNELICPVCKKECKNKAGLNAHIKTHQK